jgi:dTDP-4-amino-4,6-dideoxygalactose transaminase
MSTWFANAPWPYFDEEQIDAVVAVLRSGKVNYWTGTECREFEREYAAYLGRRHAIALANGTVALELALEAFGIGAGDEVIVPSRTYVASASCAVMRGATPVIADIDRDSQCITAEAIARCLTPRTRAVLVVHLAGWPCDMDPILALTRERGLRVIEDCAQAHGAYYKGRPIGSFGDAAAFSFCQDKIITTGGEGGLLALDDEAAWKRAWAFKDIGRSYDAVYHRQHAPGFRWLTESFGTNWRMTEMQAVLGRIQLRRLPASVEARRRNAQIWRDALAELPAVRTPQPAGDFSHSHYRFYAFARRDCLRPGASRDSILAAVEAAGIPCGVGACSEIYLERAFLDRGWQPAEPLPVARELSLTSMMFLVHPTLDPAELAHAAAVVRALIADASLPASDAGADAGRRAA